MNWINWNRFLEMEGWRHRWVKKRGWWNTCLWVAYGNYVRKETIRWGMSAKGIIMQRENFQRLHLNEWCQSEEFWITEVGYMTKQEGCKLCPARTLWLKGQKKENLRERYCCVRVFRLYSIFLPVTLGISEVRQLHWLAGGSWVINDDGTTWVVSCWPPFVV